MKGPILQKYFSCNLHCAFWSIENGHITFNSQKFKCAVKYTGNIFMGSGPVAKQGIIQDSVKIHL